MTRKIHVGCGPHNLLEGWTNVDIREFEGVDMVLDVTETWPFDDVDFVYGEHFIEHLPIESAVKFLVNAGRSLKPGGVIRLTTPNLRWVVKTHYRFDREFTDEERVDQVLRTNRAFHGWGHRFLYDRAFLQALLGSVNFADILFLEYGQSPHAELQGIERHGKYAHGAGEPNLLVVEATRRGVIAPSPAFLAHLQSEFLRHVASGH